MPVSLPPPPTTSLSGGFIDFPSGTFTADPTSAYAPNKNAKLLVSASLPHLYAVDARSRLFYDRARSRWLAVPHEAVSADGATYAYAVPDTSIQPKVVHVVDIASGNERTFPISGMWLIPVPLEYEGGGVYLTQGWEGTDGLWELNPTTGSVQKLAGTSATMAYQDGGLWYATPRPTYGQGPDTVSKLELASEKATTWFHRNGGNLSVEGLDAQSHPVIANYLQGVTAHPFAELWLVASPGVETKLFTGEVYDKEFVLADQHGLWFGAAGGLYLYSQGNGLQRVSDRAVVPAGNCA